MGARRVETQLKAIWKGAHVQGAFLFKYRPLRQRQFSEFGTSCNAHVAPSLPVQLLSCGPNRTLVDGSRCCDCSPHSRRYALFLEFPPGHCQVVLGSLRKAMSIWLGSHLSGVAFPQIERVGPSVAI